MCASLFLFFFIHVGLRVMLIGWFVGFEQVRSRPGERQPAEGLRPGVRGDERRPRYMRWEHEVPEPFTEDLLTY